MKKKKKNSNTYRLNILIIFIHNGEKNTNDNNLLIWSWQRVHIDVVTLHQSTIFDRLIIIWLSVSKTRTPD